MFEVPIRFRFYEKLKLYNDFVSKKSIFQEKLWDECQAILVWSASPKHKYIGQFLNVSVIRSIFGAPHPDSVGEGDNLEHAMERSQIIDLFIDEAFVRKVTKNILERNGVVVSQTILNLHIMGFGELGGTGDNIRINRKGFLMGEVLIEIQNGKWGKYKYALSIFGLRLFLGLLFVYSAAFMLSFLYDLVL